MRRISGVKLIELSSEFELFRNPTKSVLFLLRAIAVLKIMANFCCSANDVAEASQRIKSHIHCTPVLTSQTFDDLTCRKIFFKCENFQKTGSIKARGAINTVS